MRSFLIALGRRDALVDASSRHAQVAAPQTRDPPELALDRRCRSIPRSGPARLPNGLQYFIRQNARPEKRVSMRLAVNAGARSRRKTNQRGLAHFIEHMAFNGTEHFKPGELVSFLESIGARFGPHVNASTSFDETIYMLDVPTDRAGLRRQGLLALHDFAAGLSLSAGGNRKRARRRARGMARPPRRGLAAHRQAIAGAVAGIALRRSPADRPAGHPAHRAARAARVLLPEVVSPRSDGRRRRRRSAGGRSREALVKQHFGVIPAAGTARRSIRPCRRTRTR